MIDGLDNFFNRLAEIRNRCENPEFLLKYGQQLISRSLAQNFLHEGRPHPWAPRVSDAHGRFKYPDKATHPILRKTGRLANATVSTNHSGESISRISISPQESTLEQGTYVPYGKYHQSEEGPRTRLARRIFLLFQPEDISNFSARARAWLWWGQ